MTPLPHSILRNMVRLELRKQFRAFAACCWMIVAIFTCFLIFGRRLLFDFHVVVPVLLSAIICAAILGIHAAQGLRDFHLAEAEFPVSGIMHITAAYVAGLLYLLPVLFLCLPARGVSHEWNALKFIPFDRLDWIFSLLLVVHLTCFLTGLWIRLPVVASFVALLSILIELIFSSALWSTQSEIQTITGSTTPLLLIDTRLLMYVLFAIMALYTSKCLTSHLYGRPNRRLPNFLLAGISLLFNPAASWFIFHFFLTSGQQKLYPWSFPLIAIYRFASAFRS